MDDLEALRRGLRRIKNGWTQGKLREKIDGKTCYCALGAMGVTTLEPDSIKDGPQEYYEAIRVLDKAVELLGPALVPRNPQGADHEDVWSFNDDEMTAHRDVIELFERAIAIKEKGV